MVKLNEKVELSLLIGNVTNINIDEGKYVIYFDDKSFIEIPLDKCNHLSIAGFPVKFKEPGE